MVTVNHVHHNLHCKTSAFVKSSTKKSAETKHMLPVRVHSVNDMQLPKIIEGSYYQNARLQSTQGVVWMWRTTDSFLPQFLHIQTDPKFSQMLVFHTIPARGDDLR